MLSGIGFWQAGAVYIAVYTLRPLTMFPAALLTLISGAVFGPLWGIVFTIIGENLSANIAFMMARYMGRQWIEQYESTRLKGWEKQLQNNGLITVMTLRFLMLPFDLVNFGCGLTAVRQRDYAIGTFFGILPGLVSFVLAGSTVTSSQPWVVGTSSVLLLALAYTLSNYLKKSRIQPGT